MRGGGSFVNFFFTNFPANWSAEDLWTIFRRYGSAGELTIPRKKNKHGHSFGFIRFRDVLDVKKLEAQLDSIWIGDRKLKVNVARFQRRGKHFGEEIKTSNKRQSDEGNSNTHRTSKVPWSFKDSSSYAEATRKKYASDFPPFQQNKSTKEDSNQRIELEFKVSEDDYRWLNGAYVGFLRKIEDVYDIQDQAISEGFFSISCSPMGGNLVLLSSQDSEEINTLLREENSWWKETFVCIKPWSTSDFVQERLAWVQCQGIPLHAWCTEFFKTISSTVGRFIKLDGVSESKQRLDVARFLIATTKTDWINKTSKIRINDCVYDIRMVEELNSDGFSVLNLKHKKISRKRNGFAADDRSSDPEFSDFFSNEFEEFDGESVDETRLEDLERISEKEAQLRFCPPESKSQPS